MADEKPTGAWGSSLAVVAFAAVSAFYVPGSKRLWSVPARAKSNTRLTSSNRRRMSMPACGRIRLLRSCAMSTRDAGAPRRRAATTAPLSSSTRTRHTLVLGVTLPGASYPGHRTICSKLHAKRDQCIVARVRRFGGKMAASFVSHATAPGVRCHAAPHSVT